jgi:Sulfotransferase family
MAGMEERFAPPERFADASDHLHDLVAQQLGTRDFGPDDYLPGLKILLMSMDYDPRFSERGRRIAWGHLFSGLFGRAHAIKSMAENPGFDRHAITRPIVITGIPRTGTTALHKLLAADPRFQGLQTWLVGAPMPRPPRETWASHPLFQRTVEQLKQRYDAAPKSRAAHLMVAEEVDECCFVLRQSFVSNLWTCGWSAATYDAWWQCQSELPSYRHLARTLQLMGSNESEKRWLLKNPGHIANLDLLFTVVPDALVVQTHRDPAKAVPSLCALLMHLHPIMEEGRHRQRAHNMLARETAKWSAAIRHAEPVRQARPRQVLDVVHGDFHRNPMQTIERIYAFAGLDLSPAVRSAMAQRIEDKPELSRGVHRYDVADFGMTQDEIRERFRDYIGRFDLTEKRSMETGEV